MADSKRSTIHLVQTPSPKPQQSADPKDIAAEVLEVVRECKQGLYGYRAEAEVLVSQWAAFWTRWKLLLCAPSGGNARGNPMSHLEQFSTYLRSERGASDNTVTNYLLDIERFERWLSRRGKRIEKVKRLDVQKFLVWLMGHGLSPRSASRCLATLKTFYGLLIDDGVITLNPAKDIESPKISKALPKTVSESDVGKMARCAGSRKRWGPLAVRDKAIVLTFYASGLRESELANLKLSDLDLGSGFVKVWNGKGGTDGIAPLSPPAVGAIERYLRVLRPKIARDKNSPYLFLGRRGAQFTRQRIWQVINAIGWAALGKRISPHMLRHAVATALIKGGADIRDVQAILRHADISTTQIYVHTDLSYLRRIYDGSHPRA